MVLGGRVRLSVLLIHLPKQQSGGTVAEIETEHSTECIIGRTLDE